MKNVLLFLLLLSVGFNIGLVYKMTRAESPGTPVERYREGRGFHKGPDGGRGKGEGREAFWQGMMERRLTRMVDRLDLSEEQAVAFRQRHAEAAPVIWDQRRRVGEARLHLTGLISAAAVDADSVRTAINAISRQQSLMDSLVTETMLSELEILDDSQRAMYLEILPASVGFGRGGRPGGGGNHRGH